jgi:hypothetical protein
MFWAAVSQTIVASGALFFLMQDLRQNRASVDKQLRPYVFVENVLITEETGEPRFKIVLKNYGQVPAVGLRVRTKVTFADYPLKTIPPADRNMPVRDHIPQNEMLSIWINKPSNAEKRLADVREGKKVIFSQIVTEYDAPSRRESVTENIIIDAGEYARGSSRFLNPDDMAKSAT